MVIPEIQASILDILDMGITTHYGYRVCVINFMISINESKPEEISGYYDPRLRDSIIKNLKRLNFQKANDLVLDENDELKLHK
jgi:hypothetical protein